MRAGMGMGLKEQMAADIDAVFFDAGELADVMAVDGKELPAVWETHATKERADHWEAGAKQNFDTGLYQYTNILYLKAADYGPRPPVGKLMKVDGRGYRILACEEEAGVYRFTLDRVRQR